MLIKDKQNIIRLKERKDSKECLFSFTYGCFGLRHLERTKEKRHLHVSSQVSFSLQTAIEVNFQDVMVMVKVLLITVTMVAVVMMMMMMTVAIVYYLFC